MSESISLTINGEAVQVTQGTTVAVAVMQRGILSFRSSVSEQPRGPLCGMGICFECRVSIDGELHQRSCQLPCRPGMKVVTDG